MLKMKRKEITGHTLLSLPMSIVFHEKNTFVIQSSMKRQQPLNMFIEYI